MYTVIDQLLVGVSFLGYGKLCNFVQASQKVFMAPEEIFNKSKGVES